jgi:hypothetical protein
VEQWRQLQHILSNQNWARQAEQRSHPFAQRRPSAPIIQHKSIYNRRISNTQPSSSKIKPSSFKVTPPQTPSRGNTRPPSPNVKESPPTNARESNPTSRTSISNVQAPKAITPPVPTKSQNPLSSPKPQRGTSRSAPKVLSQPHYAATSGQNSPAEKMHRLVNECMLHYKF